MVEIIFFSILVLFLGGLWFCDVESRDTYWIQVVVRDDLSTLDSFSVVVQGKKIRPELYVFGEITTEYYNWPQ